MVTVEGLTKEFPGGVRALDGLNLSIMDGEFFALLGPSGCGKTTLLRTIAGLESPTSGAVRIGDRDVTPLAPGARNVAMVFQDYALFPHMTVRENIAYPLKIKRQPRGEREARAGEIGGQLGLAGLMPRRPAELSGGQQQRVALARAVACRPSVFLFDEPLSNLDARLRLEARTFLKRLQRELAVTTVFVTHDQAEALALADRIAVMDAGQIRQIGTAREVFRRPSTTFVANFIGSTPMNLLSGEVRGDGIAVAGGTVPRPDGLSDGEPVTVGIRPEYLPVLTSAQHGALSGEVSIVEHLGTSSLVTVEIDGELVAGTVAEGDEPDTGTRVWLRPVPGRVLIYRVGDGTLVS
ncbi:ABC transporter ATP-binding protein [Rugosimonospora africana]|uniref:Sugar ABC transporter ATP-binding protein n=1 Tax=Rugosimonospora africana TaxID=556532 RepID=A0A8J3VRC9_9ACTN|nr:ABC transporter ATP-binding protein [Rugosimonospora africana]GIH15283.1 sugar ABC transporter ATP-binding protein [Rugosimonospora africana]